MRPVSSALFLICMGLVMPTALNQCARRAEEDCWKECSNMVPQCDDTTARIEGGCLVKKQTMPWAVIVSEYMTGPQEFGKHSKIELDHLHLTYWNTNFCSGSLITPTYVLSAAHCFYFDQELRYEVWAGGTNRSTTNVQERMRFAEVNNLIIYPEIENNITMWLYDVALLQLKTAYRLTNLVRPICLAKAGMEVSEGFHVTIAGWGSVSEDPEMLSPDLKMAHVPHFRCLLERPTHFCTEEVPDKAQVGDSGGPLTFFIKGQEVLTAVNSHHQERPDLGANDSVYIRVTWALPWIHQNIEPCWIEK